jgi:hypothetical protein
MRFAIRLLAIVVAAATIQIIIACAGPAPTVSAATIQSDSPQITGVRRKGKKLFVAGDHFTMGAVILVNGERQKTRNDEDNPTSLLIAKKAGNRIGPADIVTIEVLNADSDKSPVVNFFGGPTITRADAGQTIKLALHSQFLVSLDSSFEWSVSFSNPAAFPSVPVPLPVFGAQGVFQAEARGTYTLTAKGDPLCGKLRPPCKMPSPFVEITLIVQ